jgi:hypothetical protein
MRLARDTATRCGMLITAVIALQPASARAADDNLFLPVVEAARISEPVEQSRTGTGTVRRGISLGRSLPTRAQILPSRVEIPDLYAQEYDITLRPWVAPVNADRVVSFDLLPKSSYRPWGALLAYDEEKRGPLPGSGDVVRFVVERKF